MKKVLVSSGATVAFEELIHGVASEQVLRTLARLGFSELIVQYGVGEKAFYSAKKKARDFDVQGIEVIGFSFITELREKVQEVDLVISHAGTGSILDVLHCRKPLIVVPNKKLMDNHQIEIGRELARLNHIILSDDVMPDSLADAIDRSQNSKLDILPETDGRIMANIIDQEAGLY